MKKISLKSRSTCRQAAPLILSVKKDRKDLIEILIEKGKFDVNAKTNDASDWCALATAVSNHNDDLAKFLVTSMKAGNLIKMEQQAMISLQGIAKNR